MSYRTVRNGFALTILTLGLIAAVPAAIAEDTVCDGYDRKSRIHRLGGRAAFSKPPITSPGELKNQMGEHRTEIETIMKERGLGDLTAALYQAVESGEGLSERDLERGEVFEWMAYRKGGKGVTHGPMCVATSRAYSAYVVEITETEEHPAEAECALKASGACAEDKIEVDAGGSSEGVEVEMSGPGGAKTIISGGSTTWDGMAGAGKYTFTAKAQAQGTNTVTTHTFVIPKVCLNLAYLGKTSEEVPGETATCSADAEIEVRDCEPVEPRAELVDTPVVEAESRWTARFFALRLDPDDGSIDQTRILPSGLSERSVFKLDGGVGGGAGIEYHFNQRIGLEGTVLYVPLGSDFFFDIGVDWAGDSDDVSMLAFLIGPNFHLTPDKKVDFYIGPFIGIADLGGTSYQVLGQTQNRSLDTDTLFGVQLGLDIPFGDGAWAVHLGARYMDMTVEADEEGAEIAADPLGFEVGFAYSF